VAFRRHLAIDPSESTLYVVKTEATGGSVIGYRAGDGTVIGAATDPRLTLSSVSTPDPSSSDIFMAWTETSDFLNYHIVIARRGL
jgi:hypothetical protein